MSTRRKKKSETVRATLYLEKRPLWILQCPPNSPAINGLLLSLANAVEDRASRLEGVMREGEWRYLGACALHFPGCLFTVSASIIGDIRHCALVEGPRDGLPELIWPGEGETRLKTLDHKLVELNDIDGLAILAAIGHFAHCPRCPTGEEDWWTVSHRLRCERAGDDDDGPAVKPEPVVCSEKLLARNVKV